MAGPAAPFCHIEVAPPPGQPNKGRAQAGPQGMQIIPPGSTLHQITNIVNNNFNKLIKGNFVEINRGSRITRIYDPQDSSVYVDVRQITHVRFGNPDTGQTITWTRGGSLDPAQPPPPSGNSGGAF